mgnify:CR=1 FL=1
MARYSTLVTGFLSVLILINFSLCNTTHTVASANDVFAAVSDPFALQTGLCKIIDNNGNCLFCFRDQYLVNSACVSIPSGKTISNCNIYNSDLTCYECDSTFAPNSTNTLCLIGNTSFNCNIFKTSNTCSTCNSNMYLNSNSVCVGLANCVAFNSSNVCIECSPGYYLLQSTDGSVTCQSVIASQIVLNCAVYDSLQKCSYCSTGYVLSTDRLTCSKFSSNLIIDANCKYTLENSGNYCNICTDGFYLVNGVCKTCSTGPGCLVCDPAKPSVCLLCSPNYYMSTQGDANCVKNASYAAQTAQTNTLGTGLLTHSLMSILLIALLSFN